MIVDYMLCHDFQERHYSSSRVVEFQSVVFTVLKVYFLYVISSQLTVQAYVKIYGVVTFRVDK